MNPNHEEPLSQMMVLCSAICNVLLINVPENDQNIFLTTSDFYKRLSDSYVFNKYDKSYVNYMASMLILTRVQGGKVYDLKRDS